MDASRAREDPDAYVSATLRERRSTAPRLWTGLTIPDGAPWVMPRIELYEGSQKVADIGLPEKKFSTGSIGYWATQKLEINGKRYQCQFQLVEIGTKQEKKAEG